MLSQLNETLNSAEESLKHITEKAINCEYFEDLLNMNPEAINFESNYEPQSLNTKECELVPQSCIQIVSERINSLKFKKSQLNEINRKIEDYKDVINFLKKLSKDNKKRETIFHEFRLDREGKPVCIYFDKNDFEAYSDVCRYFHSMDIYLSFGDTHFSDRTFLYFEYKRDTGSIWIIEMYSVNKKRWHAKYMLEALEKLIPYFNERIEKINYDTFNSVKNYEYWSTWEKFKNSHLYSKPITFIHGKMKAGKGISQEELVKFYDKVGYLQDGRLYKEISCANII